uniref:MAX gene-associated protein n=1 Tax=Mandrillus leucophaeus TaxID=9568 RepID=A0A2K5YPG8_MANLE
MEEKQQIILANQDGGTVAGAAPTFFVILKQPGNGKTDQGILVTNQDACALASSVSSPVKSKGKICLPADCTVGGITVTLDNNSMWNEFYHRSTEMILTKQGRRMFPYCRYWITGLDSNLKYILVMDISPVDNHRYKWNGRWWEPSGKAEPHVLGRVFIHPESPSTGHYWMHQPVSFYKLKLTNNTLDQEGHIILHSMHRYLPRLHLVPAEKAVEVIQLNGPGVHTFTFPQTEFFAVTAYQNIQITQLKIDYNPFAKGFRDDGLNSKPQRDGKQKNNSDQEGNIISSSSGHRVRLTEGQGSEIQPGDLDPLSRGHETSGKGLEKTSLNIKRDFLGFMDTDSALSEVPQLKQEISECLIASSFADDSHVASPLDQNGSFNVVIKEEPLDDYDYELGECPEGVTVKQEETDEETDVYSNSDDDPILEKQLKRHNKVDNPEADHLSSKWLPSSPSGVAKAKMFKLDTGKMPVVYLEPCAVTRSTVKISELPDNMLSTSRKDKSSMLAELEYLPTYIENSNETAFCLGKESENGLRKHSSDLRVVQKYPSLKDSQWKYPDISDSINTERILDSSKGSVGDLLSGKEDLGRKRTTMLKIATPPKVVNANQNASPNVPGKRGRPRKLKLCKAGRPPKNTGKSLISTKNTPVGPGSTFPDVKPDLEDVDGVLFVSFESKEALDIHAVDGTTEESSSLQASTTNDSGYRARISQLEKELIEDLKSLRHKQVIHPGLQEVGLKLNSVDPTVSIDLKYLGVQLPLAPATSFPFWNLSGTNPASPDAGFPFVSRTGKTNDFTKIKGWRGKFHSASASRNEASLKTKPIHTIIRKRAPPCNNDFCRLGCVCSSLALEKRQPAHCRRPDCMFGCTCLKRKVVLVKGGSKTKHFQRKAAHPRDPVFYDTLGEEAREEEEGIREEEEQLKEKKKRKKLEYTICETEPEQPVRHYPLWVKVEGEVDPEPVYIPTPSVIEPMKPLLLPQPEVLSPTVKGKLLTGIKSARSYIPRPNPVIREEDKDPVYLYFESMMTCARVRVYERKKEDQRQPSSSSSPSPSFQQQSLCHSSPENHSNAKEPDCEQQPLKQLTCDLEDDSDKLQEKSWKSPCNEGESSSTSYMHQRSPGGPTKLIEIISDCNWEEDRNKILSILSQHINSNMPQSLKVGSFIIELASQRKSRGEKNPPVYSSRVKISMPSCQDQDDMAEKSGSETPDGPLSPGKMEDISPVQTDALDSVRERLHGGKGLPFYAGLSPAGKLVAYKRKPSSSTSGLIQVASNAKVAASRKPRTLLPSTSNSKMASSSGTATNRPGKNLKAFVPAKRPIAARPSPGGVFTQFVMSKVGALQQKIPGVSTPQTLAGTQKFSIRPSPVMVVTPVVSSEPVQVCSPVTAAVTTTTPQVFLENVTAVTPMTAISDVETKETTYSSGATTTGVVEVSETNTSTPVTSTQSTATVNLTKTTGITTPVASVAFPKSLVASPPTITLPVASTASTSLVVVTTAASSSMVTTPTSSLGSVPIILSGINGSPPVSQRPENAAQIPVATPQVSPNTVKRAGPRLLLIPVQQGSPTLRPVSNTQLQGHRMVLQPVRSPSGMNLFRHPNGQIVQLLPLHQLRGSNTQPNLQPVMFRNPGSVMGIRLPAPSKPSETPPSSTSSSAFSVMNPVIQAVGSSSAVNVITQAPSLLSSGASFVSQAGTLTLRISPPEPQSFASKTGSETKITYSSGGQPVGTASLIPLQSGSFALLQLPGQKPVPSSILQHVASLQMKRESQNPDQKDETNSIKREQETKKVLQSEGEAVDSEANIIKQNSGAATSEETLNDSLEDRGDHLDEESLPEEGSATVKPSEHSCITGSHTDQDYKDVNEEYGARNRNSSKEKVAVLEVRTISEKAGNKTVQNLSKVQHQKLGDVKVEQQKVLDNPEENSSEFPVTFKEESKFELSGSKVMEQQSNPQPEAKEKECGDSLEKDSIRERWRKHLKGPLTRKCVGASQECKKEVDEQLIKETKTCQENSDVFQQEQGISDLLGKSGITEDARVLKTECDSWSRISNPSAFSIVPRRAAKSSRGNGHFQGHLLLPGEQIQPKQEKKGGRSSADFTVLDLEEDDDDENEKTDDSIDEIVDVVSDYQSEEVDDVEKTNCVEYIEDDEEHVDIETVEELSEEINVAHLKTTVAHTQSFKQPSRTHISADEKAAERSRKAPPIPLKLKPDYWSDKLQKEAEAFAYYRRTHTANERRRRGEMRDLFEKLKITLGLLHSSKVSKSLILTRAFSEIQGLTDQADKLIGQKNLLTRKRNILIRKVSSLSGKTEEVVLKKLEYIYAKQQALEAQKRKKKMGSDEFDMSPRISKQQEGSSTSCVDLGQMFINNRRGKPLILSRKKDQATENTSPSNTPHTSANLVMTPQGQLLTLKGPLFSGPVVTVSPDLLESDLKPQVASSAVALPENDDLFMMPRIVNVTSLATEGGLVDMGGSKYPHEVPDGKPSDHLKDTVRNEDNSLEDKSRISSRGNRDGRVMLGPTQVFLANKDSGYPQIVDVSSMQKAQEFLPKKISGDMRGIQYKWKESESRGERVKSKESSFHKLKMKDLKDSSIEMELRKVTSAIEEAALDSSELLTNMEDEDDTDETLTSLLNEIAFLNQQLNDDSVSLAELPSSMDTEFPGDARRAFISKVTSGNRAAFQVEHLGTGLKELPDVQGESDSISPLLLHLEDDDFSENEKQLAEPASEPDVLKIVIDSEIKDSLLSNKKAIDGGKNTSGLLAEPESVSSPPTLHMKTGLENSNSTDTLWRPMPKLAPLGLKVANPSSDADGQSLKVMPCLAPIAAKVGSVGHKMNLTGNDPEGRESKVMPTLAPVVAKLGNSGASPSSAGK